MTQPDPELNQDDLTDDAVDEPVARTAGQESHAHPWRHAGGETGAPENVAD